MLYLCTCGTIINTLHLVRIDEPSDPMDPLFGKCVATLSNGSGVELHTRGVLTLREMARHAPPGLAGPRRASVERTRASRAATGGSCDSRSGQYGPGACTTAAATCRR